MNYFKISTVLLAILSVVLFFSTVYYATNPQIEYRETVKNDTILIKSTDTITIEKTNISYRDIIVLDTLFVKDTSLVVEQKVFEDSISTIFISGVNPELDSIKYRLPKDTVIVNSEIVHTVQKQDSFWKNRFTISAGLFGGYGLIHRQPDVFLGVGCAVRIF